MQEVRKDLMELHQIQEKMLEVDLYQILYVFHLKNLLIPNDNTFKNKTEISKKFEEIIDLNDDNRVFSCGSGITACVLSLAYSLVNNTYSPTVYDGSWAEYGRL